MKSFVSEKIRNMPPSGIRKFFDVASELKDVISLGVGEPDFYTPWRVREEAIHHLENKRTVYTSNAGLLPLREEIARYTERKYNIAYDAHKQIIITVGGSEAIDIALRACLETGDEVIYHEPCFVSYKPCIELAGGVPVPIKTSAENGFKLTPDALISAITPATKILMISYPSNPTGAVMERDKLEELADVLREHDILVISDEIYSELTYGTPHVSIASLPGMYDKTVYINGFSKAYAMTGWRLGYACGPPDIIDAMNKIHQYAIMCAPTTSQYAAVTALRECDAFLDKARETYDAKRRLMVDGFRGIGLSCFEPLGAFYVFPSIKSTGYTSEEFCMKLLTEYNTAVVPGTAFGECGEGYIRCCYAYSVEEIKAAMERIEVFVKG